MKTLIVFHSQSGHTLEAAYYLEQGLLGAGFEVIRSRPAEFKRKFLEESRVVLVGTPCHAGSVPGCNGISKPIRDFLGQLPENALKGRIALPFCVYSRYGGRKTLTAMSGLLGGLGADVVMPGIAVRAGSCLSLWSGPNISQIDAKALRDIGVRIKALPGIFR